MIRKNGDGEKDQETWDREKELRRREEKKVREAKNEMNKKMKV